VRGGKEKKAMQVRHYSKIGSKHIEISVNTTLNQLKLINNKRLHVKSLKKLNYNPEKGFNSSTATSMTIYSRNVSQSELFFHGRVCKMVGEGGRGSGKKRVENTD
jgi:hypothetical protein